MTSPSKKRYTVKNKGAYVELTLSEDYSLDSRKTVYNFWCPLDGSLVLRKRGRLGPHEEVCSTHLFSSEGPPLMSTRATLAVKIRRLAKRYCDRVDSNRRRL